MDGIERESRRRGVVRVAQLGLVLAASAAGWSAGPAAAQNNQPLSVGIVSGASTADPRRIAQEMGRLLQQTEVSDDIPCQRSFSITDVKTTGGPLVVESGESFNEVEMAGPHFVHVVREIRFCGALNTYAGCARGGGESIVVVGMPNAADAGVIWAHEFGHTTGLPHSASNPSVLPDSLMHERIVDLLGRSVTETECFSFQTPKNPNGFPGRGGPFIGTSSGLPPAAGEGIESFVRTRYLHGVPLEQARRYGPEHVPTLLRMLAEPSEAAHVVNIVTTLGLIGDEASALRIMDYVRSRPAAPRELHEHQALSASMLALGFIAGRTRSESVLAQLLEASESDAWLTRQGRWSRGAPEQADEMVQRAAMGLAVSGASSAHRTLRRRLQQLRLQRDTSPAGVQGSQRLAGTTDEFLRINEQVSRGGLAGYYGWHAH